MQKREGRTDFSRPRMGGTASVIILPVYIRLKIANNNHKYKINEIKNKQNESHPPLDKKWKLFHV